MDAKAVFLSSLIAVAAALSAAMAQVPPSGGVTVPPDRPLVPPGLGSGSELERYDDTYIGLHSFWSDDIISRFFKHAADGTLNQVTPHCRRAVRKMATTRSASPDQRRHHRPAGYRDRSEPVVPVKLIAWASHIGSRDELLKDGPCAMISGITCPTALIQQAAGEQVYDDRPIRGDTCEGNRRGAERHGRGNDHEAHRFVEDHCLQRRNRNAPISSGNRNSAPPRPISPPSAPMTAPPVKAVALLRRCAPEAGALLVIVSPVMLAPVRKRQPWPSPHPRRCAAGVRPGQRPPRDRIADRPR